MSEIECLLKDSSKCQCCQSKGKQCKKTPAKGQKYCSKHLYCLNPATDPSKLITLEKQHPLIKTDSEFRIYQMNELTITPPKYSTSSHGSYGSIVFATIKATGQHVVLKKYLTPVYGNNLYQIIPNIREIMILRHLNQYPETKTVKLYGICLDGPILYLILEQLEKTLANITVDYRNRMDKNGGRLSGEQYKIILYQLLSVFNRIHSLGFIHNDIKLTNIMISHDEKDIRIIDFGLSEYLGVGPLIQQTQNYHSTEEVKAPDDKTHLQYVQGNRKSYASDVYSIAVSMIHMILRGYRKIYVDTQNRSIQIIINGQIHPNNLVEYLTKKIGPLGVDLLFKLIDPVTVNRWCCRKALQHEYFKGIDQLLSRYQIGSGLELVDKRLKNQYIDYLPDNFFKKNMELCYYDSIHDNYQNDLLPMIRINQSSNDFAKYQYFIFTMIYFWLENIETYVVFDSLFNTMIMVKNSFNVIQDHGVDDRIIHGLVFNSLFDYLVSNRVNYQNYSLMLRNGYDLSDWLSLIKSDFLCNDKMKVIFIPIWCHIMYMYIEFFYRKPSQTNHFFAMISSFTIDVGKWVLFYYFNPYGFDFPQPVTSWELVQYCTIRAVRLKFKLPTNGVMERINQNMPTKILTLNEEKIRLFDQYYEQSIIYFGNLHLQIVGLMGYDPFKMLYE
ncbi:MAG: protein kinase family protein [candidate division WOR-3 bacterium]